jgi:hypothetical protein
MPGHRARGKWRNALTGNCRYFSPSKDWGLGDNMSDSFKLGLATLATVITVALPMVYFGSMPTFTRLTPLSEQLVVNGPKEEIEKAALGGHVGFMSAHHKDEIPGKITYKGKIDNQYTLDFGDEVDDLITMPFMKGSVRATFQPGHPIKVTVASKDERSVIRVDIAMKPIAETNQTLLEPSITFSPGNMSTENKQEIEGQLPNIGNEIAIGMAESLNRVVGFGR